MSQMTILHLFGWDKKFVLPFRHFIREHFADGRHKFIIYGDIERNELTNSADTEVYYSLIESFYDLSKALHHAEKIILHGLFSSHLLYILALQPWLLKKCHWVIWGGDLYAHEGKKQDLRWEKNEFFRRFVIQRVGYLLSYVPGDAELARKWYGAKGKYLECLMYQSNVFDPVDLPEVMRTTITVLVGNSADPSNNHFEIFERMCKLNDQNFKLICPLSYGNRDYAEKVVGEGMRLFGDRFVPLLNFMLPEKYLELLAQVDIAIFAHKRQQGMGNTITLLGLGKKVFMRTDVTPWKFFEDIGVKVFDVKRLELGELAPSIKLQNMVRIKKYFSLQNLRLQWEGIFSS